jgi:hypothetical protein
MPSIRLSPHVHPAPPLPLPHPPDEATTDAPATYSKYSYYTTLALYALSFPGLISLVTRSVKSKDVRRTFEAPGPLAKEGKGKALKVVAGEVMAYFLSQNYQVGREGRAGGREGGGKGGTEGKRREKRGERSKTEAEGNFSS